MSDALASLRTALGAGSRGMRRIPLTLESYQHVSKPLSQKLLWNMYVEQQPSDATNSVALLPTPGVQYVTTPAGIAPVSVMNDDLPGYIYCINGEYVTRIAVTGQNLTPQASAFVGAPAGGTANNRFYSIACSPKAAVICVPPNAYVMQHPSGTSVSQITNGWPSYGASSVTFLDGYFVFTGQTEPEKFFITRIDDPTSIDALDFASLDAFPNAARKVLTVGTDLWFAGDNGFEIWYDAGNLDFPFRRQRGGGILQRPVASPHSVVKGDKGLFFLSSDGHVYRTNGYQEQRISHSALEHFIGGVDPEPGQFIRAAFVTQPRAGHIVYYLTFQFPQARTYGFDVLSKTWHNVSDYASGPQRSQIMCCTQNTATAFVGDEQGRIGKVMMDGDGTYMGDPLERIAILPPLNGAPGVANAETKRAYCHRLEIEMEVGEPGNGTVILDWSDDGGFTFGAERTLSTSGSHRQRVFTTRLGSYRQRMFRLRSAFPMTIYAISADISDAAH